MEMNDAGKRRLNVISGHLSSSNTGDISSTHVQVQPLNCSSYLTSSVIRRCDNIVYFARQGSESSSAFMRPASLSEVNSTGSSVPLKSSSASPKAFLDASDGPMFSRPSTETKTPSAGIEPPLFSRPSYAISEQHHFVSETKLPSSGSHGSLSISQGSGWSPRMDVAESGRGYVITVEIPGVKINDIRVEVDDQKLTITGKRSNQYYEAAGYSSDSISSYHKREILQGPYQVVWPLPININKDAVLAEFWDGFLRIILPKV